jgi:hypothetical protein
MFSYPEGVPHCSPFCRVSTYLHDFRELFQEHCSTGDMLRSVSSQRTYSDGDGREESLLHPVSPVACPSLSICMIAHNEAPNIARALASVIGWAAEIIVLDC